MSFYKNCLFLTFFFIKLLLNIYMYMQKTAHHTAKVHKSFEKKKKLTQYFLPIHIKTKLYS